MKCCKRSVFGFGVGVVALSVACLAAAQTFTLAEAESQPAHGHMRGMMMMGSVNRAVAVLVPTKGHDVHGVVYFQQVGQKVHITGDVKGLQPGSVHGFHAHQYGDLTSADGSSLGGHYNPEGNPHAMPPHEPRHAGDFGNITANAQGVAKIDITVDNITVAGMRNPILGRGIIVHAKKDDGSQPSGDAGARIAMGVIGVANPDEPKQPASKPAGAQ